jgi:hypothetical protein
VVSGKELYTHPDLLETNQTMVLTASGIPVETGKKYELSFTGRTDGAFTVEANERIRLMNLRDAGSHVRIRFHDEQGNELKRTTIDVPVLSRDFHPYVRVFYPPLEARTLSLVLAPGKDATLAVRDISIRTDLQGSEAECINIHPVFDAGDLNSYGYRPGYGGGFFTRPDGKTVWNSGFTGTTPFFPVRGDTFYDFQCRGKKGEPKSFIYLQCYKSEDSKPFKTMKYGVSETDAITRFKMPAEAIFAQLTCYYVIIEEFRVVESARQD